MHKFWKCMHLYLKWRRTLTHCFKSTHNHTLSMVYVMICFCVPKSASTLSQNMWLVSEFGLSDFLGKFRVVRVVVPENHKHQTQIAVKGFQAISNTNLWIFKTSTTENVSFCPYKILKIRFVQTSSQSKTHKVRRKAKMFLSKFKSWCLLSNKPNCV